VGLQCLPSGESGHHRTRRIHGPQNSKVCEIRAPSTKVSLDRQAVAETFPT
jgi:hypothetical protein